MSMSMSIKTSSYFDKIHETQIHGATCPTITYCVICAIPEKLFVVKKMVKNEIKS